MATANPNARVPAWKRIGLKLKYAKDTTEENTPPVSNSNPDVREEKPRNPGKRSAEDAVLETPAKRVKSYSKPLGDSQGQGRKYGFGASQPSVDTATKTPKRIVFDEEGTPVQGKGGRLASLRKSVSFTPDTKVEDGFSASNFFKAWVNGGSGDDSNTSEPSQPEPEQAASPSKDPKLEKKKKPKKSKSTLLPPAEATKTTTTPEKKPKSKPKASKSSPKDTNPNNEEVQTTPTYLTYLAQFHNSKSTWKFNKRHQQNLLKNLFNIYRIPMEHNAAIVEYIAGLQGSARERVAREAGEVLKGIGGEEAMEAGTAEERMEACCAALKERAEELENGEGSEEAKDEKRREAEKGRRAVLILKEALNDEALLTAAFTTSSEKPSEEVEQKTSTTTTSSATSPATEKPSQSQPDKKPQRRKRKSRTDVSSSSESSSSESDSD